MAFRLPLELTRNMRKYVVIVSLESEQERRESFSRVSRRCHQPDDISSSHAEYCVRHIKHTLNEIKITKPSNAAAVLCCCGICSSFISFLCRVCKNAKEKKNSGLSEHRKSSRPSAHTCFWHFFNIIFFLTLSSPADSAHRVVDTMVSVSRCINKQSGTTLMW